MLQKGRIGMKYFKKIVALIISILMFVQPFAFAASVADFLDFPNDWSTEAMTAAVENGLFQGNTNKLLEPGRDIKRSEFAAFIVRAFGATVMADISDVEDVNEQDWFYKDVACVYQMRAFNGRASTMFEPEESITREEVFTVLGRLLCLSGTNETVLEKFSDSGKISDFAKDKIIGLLESGYIDGYPDGTIRPLDHITRAEIAQLFHNIFRTYISEAGVVESVAANGAVMVRAKNVDLKNVVINGDLIIADGVGAGDFDLTGVTVNGRILVRGGEGKVTFKNVNVTDGVIIYDVNGTVNFNNYRTEAPFKNLIEYTPATFLKPYSSGVISGGTKQYTIKFLDENGVEIPGSAQTVRYGSKVTTVPADQTSSDESLEFKGWKSSINNTVYTADQIKNLTVTGPVTYTAHFETKTFAIKFLDANGVEISGSEQTVAYGSKVTTVPADQTTTDPSLYFAGWKSSVNGNVYTAEQIKDLVVTQAVTYTAEFTDVEFTVKFVVDGSELTTYTQTVLYNQSVTSVPSDPIVTDPTMEFKGWKSSEDNTIYSSSEVLAILIKSNVTFTAEIGKIGVFTITFHDTYTGLTEEVEIEQTSADYETLAKDEFENILISEASGFVRESDWANEYTGEVHKVAAGWWYWSGGEWKVFDETTQITSDMDVWRNSKTFKATIDIPKLAPLPYQLFFNYNDEVRFLDTVKDILYTNEGMFSEICDLFDDKLFGKLAEKGAINNTTDKEIKNIHKYIKLVDILGEQRIEDMIWEFAGDAIKDDIDDITQWIIDNFNSYPSLSPDKQQEVVDSIATLFAKLLDPSNTNVSDEAKAEVKEMVKDFISVLGHDATHTVELEELINAYLDNRLNDSDMAHVKELVEKMLKSYAETNKTDLKNHVIGSVETQLTNSAVKSKLIAYVKQQIKSGSMSSDLASYINNSVSVSELSDMLKLAANTQFSVIKASIETKINADKAFAKNVIYKAIDADNAAFDAKISVAIGVDVSTMENSLIKDNFDTYIGINGWGSLTEVLDEAVALMETNKELRDTAIDSYVSDANKASLANELVTMLNNNPSLFDNSDVAEILNAAVETKINGLSAGDPVISDYVDQVVDGENYDILADIFVEFDATTRHEIVNEMVEAIFGKPAFDLVIDELVEEIFEVGKIDDEMVEYFILHISDDEYSEVLNDFFELMRDTLDDANTLREIAAALGQQSAAEQTAYVDQLIDELKAGSDITITNDRLFMFEPIMEKLGTINFDFIEGKIPAKLQKALPMDKAEELFDRIYTSYVTELEQAINDVEGQEETVVRKVGSGVQVDINVISDIVDPVFEHTFEVKNFVDDVERLDEFMFYYEQNPYSEGLEAFLATQAWFDGSDNGYEAELSGYSIKEFVDGDGSYYENLMALTVLADDWLMWFYNNVDADKRDTVIDIATEHALRIANVIKRFVVDYAANGLPESLEDFLMDIEDDPDLIKYIEKFGAGAYLDKIAGNQTAANAYDKAFDKIMAKFGLRLEALLDKVADSALNRDYLQYKDEITEAIFGTFTSGTEGVYSVDTLFDKFIKSDKKEVSAKGNIFSIERYFDFATEEAAKKAEEELNS